VKSKNAILENNSKPKPITQHVLGERKTGFIFSPMRNNTLMNGWMLYFARWAYSNYITSGQRISTKGRIAFAPVTPSRAKPRFRRNALSLKTSLQPCAAAALAAYSLMYSNGEQKKCHLL